MGWSERFKQFASLDREDSAMFVMRNAATAFWPIFFFAVCHAHAAFVPVDFPKTNNIQTGLIKEFPTGTFVTTNSFATPFVINSNSSGDNYYDGGGQLNISADVFGATNVYTLINAYAPPAGAQLATVEFIGSGGADETFTLVNGVDVRDFYQGVFANTINGTTTQNAFSVSGVQDAGGTGNVNTGDVGTYLVDEQDFSLMPAFETQTLTEIVLTDLNGGGTPILLGVTAAVPEPTTFSILMLTSTWLVFRSRPHPNH